jgi:hypothetical protein
MSFLLGYRGTIEDGGGPGMAVPGSPPGLGAISGPGMVNLCHPGVTDAQKGNYFRRGVSVPISFNRLPRSWPRPVVGLV